MARQFVVRDRVLIAAPIDRCFLLSTSIALVQRELRMHPVRGRTAGLVQGGDTILWQGWQLGLPQYHESLIEPFAPPHYFRDRMIAGRFRSFEHDHRLAVQPDGSTLLADEIRFTMRWGWAGSLLGRLILLPHIRRLLRRRFALLKQIAEGQEWRQYISAPAEEAS